MFREGGLSGLIDLSRITGIPMQELSRLSPGSAVNAMQVNQALLQTIELAQESGFDILHGIVDSLWVKGKDPSELCRRASERIGITLEHKGIFKSTRLR